MDDQDKPVFSEAKHRKLKRHLDRARQAAEKEAVNQEAAANAQQEQDAPVCGAIMVALPEFTQDQSDDPSKGYHSSPQCSVHAEILGQIAVKVQRDVAYALTSTASLSNEELDELDSALNDATLLISDQLHQLDYQLSELLITSSRDPGWWSGMLQFFYIEETNVNRVLRRIDDVKRIFDKAHKSRLKISDQLATGAGSVNDLHKTLCSWEDQLNRYSISEETNLKKLQGRLKDHYSPSWFWGYLGQLEDPDALQAEIYALENQLRALWDAELRARYGCTWSNIAGIGTTQIRKALEHDGKELGEIRDKIVQLGSRLRRERDWKMAELELINILDTYFQKIERLYLEDR
ncbi:hypothetical protein Neosp_015146 [[Neocosmospora] mangrovei]